MANKVRCSRCGDSFDSRGLTAHLRHAHDLEHGDVENVVVPKDQTEDLVPEVEVDAQSPEAATSVPSALGEAVVDEDSVTVRTVQEVVVADQELKRELVEELKRRLPNEVPQ